MATQAPTLFDDLFSNEEKNEIPPAAAGNKKKKNLATKESTSIPELFPTEHTLFEESKNETPAENLVDADLSEEIVTSIPSDNLNIEPNEESLFDSREEENNETANAVLKEEKTDKKEQLADLDKTMRAEMPFFFEAAPRPEKPIIDEIKADEERVENIELKKEADIQEELEQDFFEVENETDSELPLIQSNENTLPTWNLEDKYYGIGAVAQLFGVNISHIRFWTNEFKLKVRTNKKGDRLYTPELIEKLRWIHHLVKEKGHTIKGAKAQLKVKKEVVSASISLKEQLSQLRDNLVAIRRDLNKDL